MRTASLLIPLLWVIFMVVWLVWARTAKPNERTTWWGAPAIALRAFIVGAIITATTSSRLHRTMAWWQHRMPALVIAGVVLTALGIALAIWARFFLGRNWGMPMSVKVDAELVTRGPYRWIRHPIYAGILLAWSGTTLALGPLWLVALAAFLAVFVMSTRREEANMTALFPDAYPAYRARTWAIVPGVY